MSTAQRKLGDYTQVEKLDLSSKDILSDNITKIGQLFPEVLTESSDENGRLRPAIDFDKLRQFLSREIVEGRESYEFTWVGKRGAIAEAGKPTTQTLRPDLEESVDFDKSENIFITGDNIEVVKILQESYLNKIKMIYLDPPYNTGSNMIYSNDFSVSETQFDKESNFIDMHGKRLAVNPFSSGRFHSRWLNMMYPLVRLSRNLLTEDGFVVIAMDNSEIENTIKLCDEILGEENKIGLVTVVHKPEGRNQEKFFGTSNEYAIFYAKNKEKAVFESVILDDELAKEFNFTDERGKYKLKNFIRLADGKYATKEAKPNFYYPIYVNRTSGKIDINKFDGSEVVLPITTTGVARTWKTLPDTFMKLVKNNDIEVSFNGDRIDIYEKLRENQVVKTHWIKKEYHAYHYGGKVVNELFGTKVFDFPKSVVLLKDIYKLTTKDQDIILDLFAGSATTAEALMTLNFEDGGNRRFILTQLDEDLSETIKKSSGDPKKTLENAIKLCTETGRLPLLSHISRERIRRAAKKIQEEHPETVGKQDFGFRAYKLDTSNFKDVSQTPDSFSQESLFDSVSNIKDGRTDLDLLFQIMLTWGMELSLPIVKTQIDGTDIYNVADGALIACFADEISESVLRQIAKEEPLRAVFKDESFANSAAKINLGQIFKEEAPNSKVKVV
ncbi:TPA: site-specific DNA-methyltransferase [Streptococcus suis]